MDSVTIQLTTTTSSETPTVGTSGTARTIIQTSSLSNDTLKQIGNTNTSASITPAPSSSLTSITIEIYDEALFDALSIASLIPSLRKDGNGLVIIKVKNDNSLESSSSLMSNIHAGIALAGLTAESESVQVRDDGGDSSSISWRVITSKYKPPQVSASTVSVARINTNIIAKKSTTKNSVKNKNNAITINLDLDDDDLINEDDLLNDEEGMGLVNAPPVMEARPKEDDCGGRKPCDNCTCGRAEAEAQMMMTVDENNPQNNEGGGGGGGERKIIKDMKSSCGNCSKGDAFRCAGCPFLGKPAFKEGEEHLVLDLTDDL